jgi:hypothetical protein
MTEPITAVDARIIASLQKDNCQPFVRNPRATANGQRPTANGQRPTFQAFHGCVDQTDLEILFYWRNFHGTILLSQIHRAAYESMSI